MAAANAAFVIFGKAFVSAFQVFQLFVCIPVSPTYRSIALSVQRSEKPVLFCFALCRSFSKKENSPPQHFCWNGLFELRNHLAHLNYALFWAVLSSFSTHLLPFSATIVVFVAWQLGFFANDLNFARAINRFYANYSSFMPHNNLSIFKTTNHTDRSQGSDKLRLHC